MERLEVYLLAADNPIGKKQLRPIFRRKRSGEVLTREQVAAIKKGRKVLRKEMKAQGIKEKSEFELTATNLGLYFDKHRFLALLLWFFHGRGLAALLAAGGLLLITTLAYSLVTQMQGHFTINLSDGLFKEGFILSDNVEFENASTNLFCTPAEDVPCVSIVNLPRDVDFIDGQHNDNYFAYTFYCRNEGESTVDYDWQMNINSESRQLSNACWVMIFEDGEMMFYAEPNTITGDVEALPAFDDNTRGYIEQPMGLFAKYPELQYQTIAEKNDFVYTRVIPVPFVNEDVVAQGRQTEVAPGDVHKYTVVIWLEGDDPDATNEKIGGHLGMEFRFWLVEEEQTATPSSKWEEFWEDLRYWDA